MTFLNTPLRALIAACMLALSLGLVACGGDDKKSDSSDKTTAADSTEAAPEATATDEPAADEGADSEFVTQGNQICADAQTEVTDLVTGEDLEGAVTRLQVMVTDLGALEPPAGQEDAFAQLIEGATAQNDEAAQIVADGGTAEDLGALDSTELDAISTDLGLTTCAA